MEGLSLSGRGLAAAVPLPGELSPRAVLGLVACLLLVATGCGPELLIDLGGDYPEGAAGSPPGLVGIPNIDDDDGNGNRDWRDGVEGDSTDDYTTARVDGENDLVSFTLSERVFRGLRSAESIGLVLSGDTDSIRIWSGDRVVLGAVAGGSILDVALEISEEDRAFQVEFADFLTTGQLSLQHRDKNGDVVDSVTVHLTASPLLLNHHLQESQEVWVVDIDGGASFSNQQMVGVFEDVLGDMFTPIDGPSYGWDGWIQDEIELGWTTGAGVSNQIIVDSIRDRGLDPYPEDALVGPDVVVRTWGEPDSVNSLDYFGNLEVSPPVTASGIDYPLGRIYWGGDSSLHPDEELTDFLASQRVQKPFRIDTTWLCVSHIDEFTSFVPDPDSPKGFKFIYGDTHLAWSLLEAMDPSTPLPRYAPDPPYGHDLATVGALLADSHLRDLNDGLQQDYLDPLLEEFKTELGLTDEDIVLMPSLFEEPPGCFGYVAALIPGMANLVSVTRDGHTDIFLADPFTRNSNDSAEGQADDPFIAHVTDTFPADLDLHFVDNWFVYHMALGEVHCGANVQRRPGPRWWESAAHLLEASP